jgi:hypothetical protein
MASFLQMFDDLKEFKLSMIPSDVSIYEDQYADTIQKQLTFSNQTSTQTEIVIASLIDHTGLMKIELTNINIGSQGGDSLAFLLKSPISN